MELINVLIERSVSALQTVIDLGRVIRDRRTIPFKVSTIKPHTSTCYLRVGLSERGDGTYNYKCLMVFYLFLCVLVSIKRSRSHFEISRGYTVIKRT